MVFTALETVLLMFGGMHLFEALCHAFGTLATGGYSTKNASVGAYGSAYIDGIVILFMLLAGTNFALHYRFLKGDFLVYFKNREFLFFLSLIGGATLLIGSAIICTSSRRSAKRFATPCFRWYPLSPPPATARPTTKNGHSALKRFSFF